jgi:DNA-binding MarR family transcriptional regulator
MRAPALATQRAALYGQRGRLDKDTIVMTTRKNGSVQALQVAGREITAADPVDAPSDALRSVVDEMPLWSRPGYLVRRLHQIHHALFLQECQEYDITPVQYGLLTTLSVSPDADQNSLAQEVGLDRTNVADVLARLARRKLVRRRRASHDKRMMLSRLTADGERVVIAMHTAMRRAQDRLLDALDPGERALFTAMLMRLVEANNDSGRTVMTLPESKAAVS